MHFVVPIPVTHDIILHQRTYVELQTYVIEWLVAQKGMRFGHYAYMHNAPTFDMIFYKKEHAILFKLRWL